MATIASTSGSGQELPCITFTTPTRTFERLLRDSSLASLRTAVVKKLALGPSAKVEFIQLRDGKSIDLEDDDDFDAFKAHAFRTGLANVQINVTSLSSKKHTTAKTSIANASTGVHSKNTASEALPTNATSNTESLAPSGDVAQSFTANAIDAGPAKTEPAKKAPKSKKASVPAVEQLAKSGSAPETTSETSNNRQTPEKTIEHEKSTANPAKATKLRKKQLEMFAPTVPQASDMEAHTVAAPTASENEAPVAPAPPPKKARVVKKNTTKATTGTGPAAPSKEAISTTAQSHQAEPLASVPNLAPLTTSEVQPAGTSATLQMEQPAKSLPAQQETAGGKGNAQTPIAQPMAEAQQSPEEPVVKKKRGPKKKVEATATVATAQSSGNSNIQSPATTAPGQQPQGLNEEQPKKKRGRPKKQPEETDNAKESESYQSGPAATTSVEEPSGKEKDEKSSRKRKKKEALAAAEIDEGAAKKRKLAPENASSAQVADSNDHSLGGTSSEGLKENAKPKKVVAKSKKKDLSPTQVKEADIALDSVMTNIRKRIADAHSKDDSVDKGAPDAPAVPELSRVDDQMEIVEDEKEDDRDLIVTAAPRGQNTSVQTHDAVVPSASPPRIPRRLPQSPVSRVTNLSATHNRNSGDEDKNSDCNEHAQNQNEPPYPGQQRELESGNSASTTEVEASENGGEEGFAGMKANLLPKVSSSPVRTRPIMPVSSTESDSDEDGSDEDGPITVRNNVSQTPARPSAPRPSIASLKEIASKSNKELFSPRDTQRAAFPASQPIKNNNAVIADSQSSDSDSDSEDNDEDDDTMGIAREKRAGAGSKRPRLSALLGFFGTQ